MVQISGGPDWALRGFDRFVIEAKAEEPSNTTEAQLMAMLQQLLVERFDLKFHRDTVLRSGFALHIDKKGPRMRPSSGEESTTSFGNQVKPEPGKPITLIARKHTMATLANVLSQITPWPVVDETGLDGTYDFRLNWDEEQGPTLATALQEQLGLRLEPRKVPVSLFLIDSAQKPSPN